MVTEEITDSENAGSIQTQLLLFFKQFRLTYSTEADEQYNRRTDVRDNKAENNKAHMNDYEKHTDQTK